MTDPKPEYVPRHEVIDYICNSFLPDRREILAGVSPNTRVKFRQADDDSLAKPEVMVARMDELGISTLLLVACDIGAHGRENPSEFEHVANRWEEVEQFAKKW